MNKRPTAVIALNFSHLTPQHLEFISMCQVWAEKLQTDFIHLVSGISFKISWAKAETRNIGLYGEFHLNGRELVTLEFAPVSGLVHVLSLKPPRQVLTSYSLAHLDFADVFGSNVLRLYDEQLDALIHMRGHIDPAGTEPLKAAIELVMK